MNERLGLTVLALAVAAISAACGGSDDDASTGASSGSASSDSASGASGASSGSSGGSSGSGGASSASSGAAGGSSSASSGSGGVASTCNGDEGGAVPASPVELQAWLAKRAYQCWAHESVRHQSTGPHGGEVQTYLNEKLDTSMKGSSEHPQGAVSVKELFQGGTEVAGWAVLVKTQEASANGQGYYWYETFGTQAGASNIEGQGKPLCTGCHAGGKDFVLIPYPLR